MTQADQGTPAGPARAAEQALDTLGRAEAQCARALAGDHDRKSLMAALTYTIKQIQIVRAGLLADALDAAPLLAERERVRAEAFEEAARFAERWGMAPPNPRGRRADLAAGIRALASAPSRERHEGEQGSDWPARGE